MEKVCEFSVEATGSHGEIRASEELHAEILRLDASKDHDDVRTRKHIRRYFPLFCENRNVLLPREKYRKLADFPDGLGGTVPLFEFKSYQWRMYGAELHLNGKRTFVGLTFDPKKQQDDADQELLRRTAKRIGQLEEYRLSKGRVK
jgi:hypothetical protein